MDLKLIKNRIESIPGSKSVEVNAPMAKYTSFRAGGCADILVKVEDTETLKEVLKLLSDEDCPHMILGNGSNILVRDGGYRGVIVKLGSGFDSVRVEDEDLVCGGAVLMSVVAKAAAEAELAGFEFASGIPGSIGGAVFMNAGAYDGEMKQILESVHVVAYDGSGARDMTADMLDMGYRHSIFHETGDIVTEVRLKLKKGKEEDIRARMAELTARRNEKQPVNYPSAGSFFKRPEGYFAGKLIQDAGLKGLTVGGAQVSELHSGFIINLGQATASDILCLMEMVQAAVFEKFGVKMEPEVRIIGEER